MGISDLLLAATAVLLLLLQNPATAVEQEENEVASEEYCLSEIFRPQCMKNEVIFMKNATYGRRHLGRCITNDDIEFLGSEGFGCSADVLPLLHRRCSGISGCEIRVIDISTENIKPCRASLYVFLEVSYECLTIVDDSRSCTVDVSTNPVHLISSSVCGTNSEPWTIEAPHGQQLKIDLLEFSGSTQNINICQNKGVIVDKTNKRNVSICVGGAQREKHLLVSNGKSVQIVIDQQQHGKTENDSRFILRLQAVGCSGIIPPADAYLQRNGDSITIGCYGSRRTWRLNCKDGRWVGVIGNCSQGPASSDETSTAESVSATEYNENILVIVALCGFTFAICLVIICLGILCLKRFYWRGKPTQAYKTLNYGNSVRNQPADQIVHGQAMGVNRNDVQGFLQTQMPTYSVFVGEDGTSEFGKFEISRNSEGRPGNESLLRAINSE